MNSKRMSDSTLLKITCSQHFHTFPKINEEYKIIMVFRVQQTDIKIYISLLNVNIYNMLKVKYFDII